LLNCANQNLKHLAILDACCSITLRACPCLAGAVLLAVLPVEIALERQLGPSAGLVLVAVECAAESLVVFVLALVLPAPVLLAVLPVENASTRFARFVESSPWFAVFSALAPPASRFLRLWELGRTCSPSRLRLVSFALGGIV
jgi:hypothetical protein